MGRDLATFYYESVSEMLENLGKQMIYSALFSDIFEKAQKKMLDVTQNADLSADEKFKEYIKLLGGMTDEVYGVDIKRKCTGDSVESLCI